MFKKRFYLNIFLYTDNHLKYIYRCILHKDAQLKIQNIPVFRIALSFKIKKQVGGQYLVEKGGEWHRFFQFGSGLNFGINYIWFNHWSSGNNGIGSNSQGNPDDEEDFFDGIDKLVIRVLLLETTEFMNSCGINNF